MATVKLLTIQQLAEAPEVGIPVRTLRSLWHQRKIPGTVLGHRTLRFDALKVRAALDKYEVKEVGRK